MNKYVIPAKAGIYNPNKINQFWIPAFAGMTERVVSQQSHYLRDENKAEESAIEIALNNAKSEASLAAKNSCKLVNVL